jgi:two-component system sensor histidine kinase TrcS
MATESELLRAHSEELSVANSRLIEARNEAERALALAEEKVRIRSEFVLMINHELRTPLTSVVTGAELIKDPSVAGKERDQVIDAIVSDGHRLQEIIDQILAVAQVENRGLTYVLSESPFEKVCGAVVSSHEWDDLAGDHRHEGTMVRTDVRTLAHVINSLADNARTHGATTVRVGCWTEPHIDPGLAVGNRPDSAVYFTVADDGPGIDPAFLPRIFEKFEKSSFSSGTGLGLYMARMLVEALEGEIAVETSTEGTTFQIAVPCVRVPALAVRP